MPRDHRIQAGAAQINPELADIESNLAMHLDIITEARQSGLDLLVFPELSLTGYALGREVIHLAMPRDDSRLTRLASACGPMQTLVGFVEEAGPGEYYNALATLHHGQVSCVHRKVNLPNYGKLEEGKWFTAGETLTESVLNDHWLCSQWICADLWNPGLVHAAMIRRPTLLCAAVNSANGVVSDEFSNERNWLLNLSFYAMTYGTPVIMANRYGAEGDHWFWGGSCILGPRGEVLARAEDTQMLIIAELSLAAVAQARFDLPTHRDGNLRLTRELLQHSFESKTAVALRSP